MLNKTSTWPGECGDLDILEPRVGGNRMATARGMKENRQRRGDGRHGDLGHAKPPPNTIQVGVAGGNREDILKELAWNDVQAAYERVYRSLNAGNESPPLETFAEEKYFQPEIPVPIDKSRFMPASALRGDSSQKNRPQASVGNWSLEEVWRERGIPFTEAAIEFPPLESRGVNLDPNLTPEELRAFGLAPRSYDYLFENLDGEPLEGYMGGGVGTGGDHHCQSQRSLPRIPEQISEAWPPLEVVMKGMEGMNFSYFSQFPGDYLVVDHKGEVPQKKNKKLDRMGGRQTSGRGSKYGR
ncbi:hypothetical protein BSKO_09217 [Bryopsis sp. KO-2023]|nr:hypothetical protein BSKO_09217 [Bryopsis sp. KO-2023]